MCCYSPANVSGKLLNLSEEFGLHRVVTQFLLGPLVAQRQPGLNQISSALRLRDGGMEIFSDPLLAANLRDDLQRQVTPGSLSSKAGTNSSASVKVC